MQPSNGKASLTRTSIAFLAGDGSRRGFLRNRVFMLMPEGGGAISRRELGANETVEVRDRTTRSIHRLRAAEVSLYRHCLILAGRPWRILNIVG